MKLAVLVAVAAVGCTPYASVGLDTNTSLRGPVKNMVTQPAATARQETAPSVADTRSFSVAVGGAFSPRVGLEVGAHLHDVNGGSFSFPSQMGVDPTSPRYLIGSASIDVRYRWLNLRNFTSDFHMGPAAGVLVDRGLGDYNVGNGFRGGVTVGVRYKHFSLFADLYETEMVFNDGDAKGVSGLTGVRSASWCANLEPARKF